MTAARALWHEAVGQSALRDQPLEGPAAPDSCLVEAELSAVSPGTERLVASGGVPAELFEVMRCPHMGGGFPFPVKYGYSLVGRVVGGPEAWIGRRVHALHPHQSRFWLPADELLPLPPDLPSARATLAANTETALNALWDAEVAAGERALVVGFGTVGSLVARLLSMIAGVAVAVAEPDPGRRALARAMGFASSEGEGDFDVAFHASASGPGLQAAIDGVGDGGRVVELSWYGSRPVELCLGGRFHSGRKRIVGSQVGALPPRMAARFDRTRRRQVALSLLRDPAFDEHITDRVDFAALPDYFHAPPERFAGLSVLVRY